MVSKAFVYLAPSAIHGVGCFADRLIGRDEIVRCWDRRDSRWIPLREAHASPQATLIKRFGIRSRGGYWAPINFLRISTGWYMNHSSSPNLGSADGDITYHALRDIPPGDELTIDYRRMDKWHDNLSRDLHVLEDRKLILKTKLSQAHRTSTTGTEPTRAQMGRHTAA
jgi:hypothetical protein